CGFWLFIRSIYFIGALACDGKSDDHTIQEVPVPSKSMTDSFVFLSTGGKDSISWASLQAFPLRLINVVNLFSPKYIRSEAPVPLTSAKWRYLGWNESG